MTTTIFPRGVVPPAVLAAFAFVITVGGAGGELQAQEGTSPDATADELLSEIAETDDPAVGVAKARALDRLRSYLVPDALIAGLSSTAEAVDSPPVAFRLQRMAARLRLNLGEFEHGYDGMAGPLGQQGCLTDWQVVGPFDNDSMRGFNERLGPERGKAGPYKGKMVEVDWRPVPDLHRMCAMQLRRTIEPATSAVTYLAGDVTVEQPRSAKLLIGAAGAYKIWVDGELVGKQRKNLGFEFDNQAWAVDLEAGSHQILVKLASRSDGRSAFAARLVGSDLAPVTAVEMTPDWNGNAVAESEDSEGPEATGDGVLARTEACVEGSDTSAAWCTWSWASAASGLASTPWRDAADRLVRPLVGPQDASEANNDDAGETASSLTGEDLARLSEVFDRQSRRLEVVEKAVELMPDDPWLKLRLATTYGRSLGKANRIEQRRVLGELTDERPDFWPATLALADWYDDEGMTEKAHRLVDGLMDDGPSKPEQRTGLLRRLANYEQSVGQRSRARQLREKLGAITHFDGSYAWQRLSDLTALGRHEEALEVVRRQRKLHPYSSRWAREEVDVLRAMGRNDEALGGLESIEKRMPGNVALKRRRAELLVADERAEEAIAVLESALELRPQNKQLQDFLSHLRPDEAKFHDPWMVDDVRAIAEEHPPGSFARDTVVDQTIVQVQPNGLSQEVVQKVDRAVTNDGVDSVRTHSVSYTRGDEQVDVLGVKVYKPDGRVLEEYDQWRSGSSNKGGPYYNDNRYVNMRANNVEAGDLVEFRYRVRQIANENFRGDYFGDIEYVQQTVPTAYSRYVVESPVTWKLHFRSPTLQHTSLDSKRPDGTSPPTGYEVEGFELREVPAVHTDSRQPGHTDIYDYVMVSNKETYDEIGEWWWNLVEEQLIVNDDIREQVRTLTDGLEETREKVEAIHNFVVKNTRYLHVGLGIHGWKPYKTTECFSNKYGDCKDKSSLMKVMLEEAGIETNLVLVRTRKLGTVDDRPASMHVFNHAIVYIPSMDLFLDPTAEFNGTRELTPMDQGAQALIVEDGGAARLTKLPIDGADDNLMRQKIEVDLGEDEVVTSGHIVAYGQNAVHYRRSLQDPERRDEVFEKQLSKTYPGAELVSAEYKHLDNLEKPVEIHFEFKGGRLKREKDGGHFLFPYGAPKDLLSNFASQAQRNQDLTLRVPFANETTMRYRLPDNQGVDRVPDPVELNSKFGSLRIDYEREDGTFVADIRYSIDVQRIAVDEYEEFRQFMSEATSALNEAIGLTGEGTQ